MDWPWTYDEAMYLQQEYVCWRTELRLDPSTKHYLKLARWEEMARLHCGSMLNAQIECCDEKGASPTGEPLLD